MARRLTIRLNDDESRMLERIRVSENGEHDASSYVRMMIHREHSRRTTRSSVVPSSAFDSSFRVGRPMGSKSKPKAAAGLTETAIVEDVTELVHDALDRIADAARGDGEA